MMKSEFIGLSGKEVTQEQYDIIELIYMYHPSNITKEAIAYLYNSLGMAGLMDLLPKAQKALELERAIEEHNRQKAKLQQELEALAKSTI